jgi:CubicO group peptidase (beta-lactamase class C family)
MDKSYTMSHNKVLSFAFEELLTMPPIESLDKSSVEALMIQAHTPGVSIASVGKDGTISTESIGHTPGCVFFKRLADPTQCSFNDLKIEGQDAVILFNGEFFYADQKTQEVQKIEKTESNIADLAKLEAKFTDVHQLAGLDELGLISSITGRPMPEEVTSETVFRAASLSKPVFAYLVLKLIEVNKANLAEAGSGKFILPDGLTHFDLDTPLHHILPLEELDIEGLSKFDASDPSAVSSAETLTARMVLSHQTGLAHGKIEFQFQPEKLEPGELGKGHGYSNVGILYLQQVIERLTDSNLEVLAKKHVFDPLKMHNSSFIHDKSKPQEKPQEAFATNSLRTIASDYALFLKALMHDDAMKHAFTPHVFMTKDKGKTGAIGAVEENEGKIPKDDLEHVAWSLGWGLQTDDDGEVTTAYHSGDMTGSRAWVAMNIKDKTAMVYFANSHNGHILAEQIMPSTIELKRAANYFYPKWGFARNLDELGGVTNNFGLRSSPVIVAATPAAEVHDTAQTTLETTETDPLEVARETSQLYRGLLQDSRLGGEPGHSATTEGEVATEHSSRSPFQTTPKPKLPGE